MNPSPPLISAIIPCLNEELTLGICINKAMASFTQRGVKGEVIVGDNGSTDKSVEIAESLGARVVHQPTRGYGAALSAAAGAARGKYIIMADADDSYDWSQLDCFIDTLENGADFVMGNRFAGGIEAGAMPPLHRYLGNPVMSGIARWLYRSPIRDFHCGMRGFTREAFQKIAARSTGMEFASEMIINAQGCKMSMTTPFAYLLVSGCCFVGHNITMIALNALHVPLWSSVLLSFGIVVMLGYILHSLITFERSFSASVFMRYAASMSFNIPLTFATTWFWYCWIGFSMSVASPLASICMVLLNYLLSRWAIAPSGKKKVIDL